LSEGKLKIHFLGGLGEVGKNVSVINYEDNLLVIDCGLTFPRDEPGVDLVLPDLSFLLEHQREIRGLVLTHGHEDHIGAVPYLLRNVTVPIYATRLTMGLVEEKLLEEDIPLPSGSRVLRPRERVNIGPFGVELFRVNHSIPDAVGVAVHTPVGLLVHTGDFKFDQTPVDGRVADLQFMASLGAQGVHVLLSDSTNATRPGYTPSEKSVGRRLEDIFARSTSRVMVATFASNIHRIQQVLDAAMANGRLVAITGRSLVNSVEVARRLGYLDVPDGLVVDMEDLAHLPANRQVLLTTGSQGEPLSALARIASGEHRHIQVIPGETVIISATPIPGNERTVYRTIDMLYQRQARVVLGADDGVHVSGHGSAEDLKLMLNLMQPRFFVPVHGEQRHLMHHAWLAEEVGVPRANILLGDNGTTLEFTRDEATVGPRVTAGRVLIDGLGIGDVGKTVLRDREQLASDGIIVVVIGLKKSSGEMVAGPEILSRGFVYVRESEELMEEARAQVVASLAHARGGRNGEWAGVKGRVRDVLGRFVLEKTGRRPMILPIIMEV